MNRRVLLLSALVVLAIIIAVFVFLYPFSTNGDRPHVVYGISPYQDTILPIVAEKEGWYREEGLDVELRVLPWGDVMTALAGGSLDVAIQNFSSFQAAYPNIRRGGKELVFWHPLFVFKGAAIVVRPGDDIKTLNDLLEEEGDRERAVVRAIQQLKGKKIIATQGTEMEQIVLRALELGGLSREDVTLIHAQPDDGLHAFLRGEADAYSGGVTEQLKAYKEGNTQLISAADLGMVVIDGLVTTREFAEQHEDALFKLLELWYRTVQFIDDNFDTRSKIVIDYLNRKASYQFDIDDYRFTWTTTEIFPRNPQMAREVWLDPDSAYYWKTAWDANNEYLIGEGKIKEPVPHDAFWGERIADEFDKRHAEP